MLWERFSGYEYKDTGEGIKDGDRTVRARDSILRLGKWAAKQRQKDVRHD